MLQKVERLHKNCCSLQISLYHQEQVSRVFTNNEKLAAKLLTLFLVLSFFELVGVCFIDMKGLMHWDAMLDGQTVSFTIKRAPDLNVVLIRVDVL